MAELVTQRTSEIVTGCSKMKTNRGMRLNAKTEIKFMSCPTSIKIPYSKRKYPFNKLGNTLKKQILSCPGDSSHVTHQSIKVLMVTPTGSPNF